MLGPVAAGLAGTLMPAMGYLPALGGDALSLDPVRALLDEPVVWPSVRLALWTGGTSTVLSLLIVTLFFAGWIGTPGFDRFQRAISPLLSIPHVTAAFGIAFLLAPSGWILRLLSPWLTGFDRPPDMAFPQDPEGLALILGLVVKEVPFLFLMMLTAHGQVDWRRQMLAARSMGYGRAASWLKGIFPQIYPQIRLPVLAVLAFGVSVVDMALVLGPTTPPTLAVQLTRWFTEPDLERRFVASAGAVLLLLVTAGAILAWLAGERVFGRLARPLLQDGMRDYRDRAIQAVSALLCTVQAGLLAGGLGLLAIWSVAGPWRFPDALPARWFTGPWWRRFEGLIEPALLTISIGVTAALIAGVLSIGCLEAEKHRTGNRPRLDAANRRSLILLYLPLIVPQASFLFGTQVLTIIAGVDGTLLAVIWAHLVFVLPYVFLSLADPYRAWDDRYARSAACLGAGPLGILVRIKLPILLRPILVALAVGFAVSIGQYLATLFAGAGRWETLTTEAVSLAAGGDRRMVGALGLAQMLLPLLAFVAAQWGPVLLYRNRAGVRGL
ncbi:MAG: ABC transporter permease [Alphaproteobacteria bacterium]|nr:ABC transporter permease [Alphaproteobacteria bacterium]